MHAAQQEPSFGETLLSPEWDLDGVRVIEGERGCPLSVRPGEEPHRGHAAWGALLPTPGLRKHHQGSTDTPGHNFRSVYQKRSNCFITSLFFFFLELAQDFEKE